MGAMMAPAAEPPANGPRELAPDPDMQIIGRVTANIISREHYRRQPLDEAISATLFDDFLKVLDPGKVYLAQEDISSLEKYRKQAGQQLLQGDLSFPFAAYAVLVNKVDEYRRFAEELLQQEMRFDVDEDLVLDRSKLPWQPAAELRETWRKRLKNEILNLRLLRRAAASGEGPANPWGDRDPAVVVRERAGRYLQLLRDYDPMDVLELYLTSLANVYDPHSTYMSPATTEDFNIQMRLSLAGVGAVLKSEDGYAQITSIVPGGPAAKDGRLQPEDRIIAVAQGDGPPVEVLDMPLKKVVQYIRGQAGTEVRLTVLPAKQGAAAVPTVISLIREHVKLTEQEAKGEVRKLALPGGTRTLRVGVLTLPSFYIDFAAAYKAEKDYKSSSRDVARLLAEFQKDEPLDGLILDLRGNGGGSLQEAIALAGLFVEQKPVVQVRQANGRVEVQEDQQPDVAYRGPLIVMTNRVSASAAEIFAAAMQDYGRGLIVGEAHTHGKGTVQTVLELDPILRHYGLRSSAGSVKLTNAMFYRINGDSTQRRGVTPDIIFPSYTDAMDIGEEYLEHALPWDQVPPAKYTASQDLAPRVEELRHRSAERRADSPAFRALDERIALFRRLRSEKAISLNEERRWASYLEEKRMQEEQQRLIKLEPDGGAQDKKPESTANPDLFLDESLAIMVDLLAPPGSTTTAASDSSKTIADTASAPAN